MQVLFQNNIKFDFYISEYLVKYNSKTIFTYDVFGVDESIFRVIPNLVFLFLQYYCGKKYNIFVFSSNNFLIGPMHAQCFETNEKNMFFANLNQKH